MIKDLAAAWGLPPAARYIPFPNLRTLFRAAPFLLSGLGCFALDRLTGHSFFFYTGLMLTYQGAGRLINNMINQVSDHAYVWFTAARAAKEEDDLP